MSKFKVGDRVRNEKFGDGEVVFIDSKSRLYPYAVFFYKSNPLLHDLNYCGAPKVENKHGYWLKDLDLKLIGNSEINLENSKQPKTKQDILVIFNDKETIIIDKNTKKKYITKAYKEKYDKEKGLAICLLKMYGISYFDLKEMIENAIK